MEDSINIDGPAPFTNKTNVALQFFAYGDTPYDSHANTCIGEDGTKETECSRFDCTGELDVGNTCTFEGSEYDCLRDVTIPWMNRMIDAGDAAFMAHTGDIISKLTYMILFCMKKHKSHTIQNSYLFNCNLSPFRG